MPRIPTRTFVRRPAASTALTLPGGPGVRVDTMLYPGYAVPPYLRLPACQDHRPRGELATWRWRGCAVRCDEFAIEGVVTTAALHKRLARLTEVQAARFDTGFLERLLAAT